MIAYRKSISKQTTSIRVPIPPGIVINRLDFSSRRYRKIMT